MLNAESRKYFNRAFPISNSAFSETSFFLENHMKHIKKCSQFEKMSDLIEYLKTSNVTTLRKCYSTIYSGVGRVFWRPTIESPNTRNAFITETPDEIYRSAIPPTLEAMFMFASQVYLKRKIDEFNGMMVITKSSSFYLNLMKYLCLGSTCILQRIICD